MIQVSLVVALFIFGLYLGVYLREKKLIKDHILSNARAQYNNIILTRMWNSMHESVYVEKKPGVKTNPYLEGSEIVTRDGRILTRRNPAMMTREISELAKAHGLFQYHITSLNTINPANAPDEFERSALKGFDSGELESFTEQPRGDKVLFRYMAPLVTDEDCLPCHARQGYKVGDVRGGISVTSDITPTKKALGTNRNIIIALTASSTFLVLAMFLFFSTRLMRQLQAAQKEITELVVTDELTGLANRRRFFERLDEEMDRARRYGSPLSLIFIDIDHFKKANDTFGHPTGDTVLAEIGRLLTANVRVSDIVARYGGEEFAILIPAQTAAEASKAAEKLRMVIEVNSIVLEGPLLNVTISCGVADLASVEKEEGNLKDALIRAADKSLYRAKAYGRNQVATYKTNRDKHLTLV